MAESLILFAWVEVQPETVMKEINRALVRMQVAQDTFTYKTLSPIYPLLKDKLEDIRYYEKNEFTIPASKKEEKSKIEAIEPVLFQF